MLHIIDILTSFCTDACIPVDWFQKFYMFQQIPCRIFTIFILKLKIVGVGKIGG